MTPQQMHCYEAMGVLRAMAWHRPDDLTQYALQVIRDYDHIDALEEQRERTEFCAKLLEARA